MKPAKALNQTIVAAVTLVMAMAPTRGQEGTPKHPDPDSHELYLSFFFFHDDFAKWTEERITAAPTRKSQILNSSAKYLGISPSEFATLEKITAQTTASLRAVGEEARTFVQSSQKANGKVDHGALVAFDNRRRAIVQDGINEMKRSLSRQSWQGLSSYINNQHRQHIILSPHASRTPH